MHTHPLGIMHVSTCWSCLARFNAQFVVPYFLDMHQPMAMFKMGSLSVFVSPNVAFSGTYLWKNGIFLWDLITNEVMVCLYLLHLSMKKFNPLQRNLVMTINMVDWALPRHSIIPLLQWTWIYIQMPISYFMHIQVSWSPKTSNYCFTHFKMQCWALCPPWNTLCYHLWTINELFTSIHVKLRTLGNPSCSFLSFNKVGSVALIGLALGCGTTQVPW